MNDIQSHNVLENISVSSSTVSETIPTCSLENVRSVQQILDAKEVPSAMESLPPDLPRSKFEQIETTPPVAVGKPITDKDGDGIPDDFDKNQNHSVADVAAKELEIGKYKKDANLKSFGMSKSSIKSSFSIIDGISKEAEAQSASSRISAASAIGAKPMVNPVEETDPFGLKKMDSMDKQS